MAIDNDMVVSIEYQVKEAGKEELVDTNKGGHPLEFLMGRGQIIPGLEKAIADMEKGQTKTVVIPSTEAYGEYNNEAVQEHDAEQFSGIELEEGMALYGQTEDGQTVQVTVLSFDAETVTVDYNHPLAGKDLEFEVTVLDTREAQDMELESGQVLETNDGCGCGSGCGCH